MAPGMASRSFDAHRTFWNGSRSPHTTCAGTRISPSRGATSSVIRESSARALRMKASAPAESVDQAAMLAASASRGSPSGT